MHGAPSVTYPVGRPFVPVLLAAALWLVALAAMLAWTFSADAVDWRQGAMAALLAVTGGFASLSWLASPSGELQWDGAGWSAPALAVTGAGALEVALDLQRLLLVRLHAPGVSHWVWLERRRCPHRWLDLRRAVYSRATPQALPPVRPPAATP
jgi:toxin CptA